MLRWRALSGLMTLALLVGLAPLFRALAAGPPRRPGSSSEPAKYLEIYYASPVLVRMGERVRMPVDVVCATAQGHACPATVMLGTRVGSEPWRMVSAPAAPGLQFDLTGPVSRASSSATASVAFFLRAEDSSGKRTTLPPAGPSDPLRFFVARKLPAVKMPAVPLGRVRVGAPALFLPWGSGPMRAGVELGRQSATIGPPGFDVDRRGRVYLLDSLQRRLAAFDRGRLVASHPLSVGADAAMAIGSDGRAFVADRVGASTRFRKVDAFGRQTAESLGSGMVSQVRVVAGRAYALVLPLDAWIAHPSSFSGSNFPAATGLSSGLPLPAGDELIRVGAEDRVRVGTVHGDRVKAGLELTPPAGIRLGEVGLADSDGHGGYWLVVRVARTAPTPADQYEVLHIRGGRVLTVFATASHSFAEAPPLSRFVLGKDGALYQMTSSPEGMRIVRFDLKEER